jgi:hypothetical protein
VSQTCSHDNIVGLLLVADSFQSKLLVAVVVSLQALQVEHPWDEGPPSPCHKARLLHAVTQTPGR